MKINNQVNRIDQYTFSYKEKFFLDTNVWLYLLYPQLTEKPQKFIKKYSAFLDKILQKENLVLTNLLQISEFTNVIIQKEFNRFKNKNKQYSISFKEYREKEDSKKALAECKILISSMLQTSTPTDGIFNTEEIVGIANQCDKADFNDIYFTNFCVKQGLTLVTHDFDFKALDENVEIVTANENYFRK